MIFLFIEREISSTENKIFESPEEKVVVLLRDKVIEIKGGAVLPSAEGFPADHVSHNPSRNIRRKVRLKLDNKRSNLFFSSLSPRPGVSFGNPPRVTVLNSKSYTPTGDEYSNVPQNQANFNSKKQTDTSKKLEQKEKSYSEIMQELDKQRKKKIVSVELEEKIYTIKNPNFDYAEELASKLADQLYKEIRESNLDVSDISKNSGLKVQNIKNCKDHVFFNKHILDRYGPSETEYKRFDSNLQQALAWNRLKSGTFVSEDIEWLKHECAERHHELKYNAGYSESHNRAQARFDGNPWEDEWYNKA